ncbi:MAG: hypothetical protein GF401_00595 [Chitinivibrionales bacterium]|nr:hypothetical protein [Chitinivibrionales bacterium]
MSAKNNSDKKTPQCSRCGREGAIQADSGAWLCRECFEIMGSCCLEFGGDDIWVEREEKENQNKRK